MDTPIGRDSAAALPQLHGEILHCFPVAILLTHSLANPHRLRSAQMCLPLEFLP